MEKRETPIFDLGEFNRNHLWIKREDFIPFCFGGNKARKARLFFQEIDDGDYDCVVTYGSGSSNHCRIIANECRKRGIDCYIISPEETEQKTFNRIIMEMMQAKIMTVPVATVHDTIEKKIRDLREVGKHPYFIPGGGHGDSGTEAYVQCYKEIRKQEERLGIHFDYLFLASGTGTTQAGLVCGQILYKDERKIIGISIARKNPRGRDIVADSIKSYLRDKADEREIQERTIFIDKYTTGYGKEDQRVKETIESVLVKYGIPLDAVYTGKAFMGMTEYIQDIKGKNILFLHTGGTPLFFDTIHTMR